MNHVKFLGFSHFLCVQAPSQQISTTQERFNTETFASKFLIEHPPAKLRELPKLGGLEKVAPFAYGYFGYLYSYIGFIC